ncbi:glycoside hydrolase [Lecanosticta acicola]|uniref:glucan 1,3-beta-glucosidase n=1 Tax=Lecanosticta acicola TaxID=111012 RepID=A0AAI9E7X1_9PEZI|nr:glycoside hydrolase [Lecanosticta acicola]
MIAYYKKKTLGLVALASLLLAGSVAKPLPRQEEGQGTGISDLDANRQDHRRLSIADNTTTNSSNTTLPDVLRGVNIGGWLVLEKWMYDDDDNPFRGTNATDQYTFDQTPNAAATLKKHWETYFTEVDVEKIASWGINALRIPIGYWAYDDDNDDTPYLRGADEYMEKAIVWARKYGLKVLVDCHGSPGSQNGFDNSGRAGNVAWQSDDNLQQSITVLETMAQKYGSKQYADVVFGLELVNEPISWGSNNFDLTQTWSQQAYNAVRNASDNKELVIVMHDSFTTPWAWQSVGSKILANTPKRDAGFAIDTHLYQNQVASDSDPSQEQHIAKACNWTNSNLLPASSNLPVLVGEFSAQTNVCAYPDGTTTGGRACDVEGCQCSSNVEIPNWLQPLRTASRKFLEAELDAFEHSARGWFLWSYKGPGAWGLENVMRYGLLGERVTDRQLPNQCGFER